MTKHRHGEPADPAEATWWRTLCWVREELMADPVLAADEDVIACADRLIAAVRHATRDGAGPAPDPAPASSAVADDTVRRAMQFIDANADHPLTIKDIAAAAFVTPRAVQLAFARHLNTTPTAYLRSVRLERAHAELLEAQGKRGAVGAIARRWQFGNSGRFAAGYRETFGCSPNETLRGDDDDGPSPGFAAAG